jgi:hypothetical protein
MEAWGHAARLSCCLDHTRQHNTAQLNVDVRHNKSMQDSVRHSASSEAAESKQYMICRRRCCCCAHLFVQRSGGTSAMSDTLAYTKCPDSLTSVPCSKAKR